MQFTALKLPEYLTLPKAVHLKYIRTTDETVSSGKYALLIGKLGQLRERVDDSRRMIYSTCHRLAPVLMLMLRVFSLHRNLNMSQISSCVNVNANSC